MVSCYNIISANVAHKVNNVQYKHTLLKLKLFLLNMFHHTPHKISKSKVVKNNRMRLRQPNTNCMDKNN